MWLALAALGAGCADPAIKSSGGTMQVVGGDARVGQGGVGGGGMGGVGGGGMGGVGGQGGVMPDAAGQGGVGGMPPDDDGGAPTPDMALPPDPDAGVDRPPALVASIVLSEIPQADQGSADVNVGLPIEINQQPGCLVVNVDPNAAPPPAEPDFDAGPITVSGVRGGQLVYTLGADGQYRPAANPGRNIFDDNAPITASAAGGTQMGAFQLQVSAPSTVNVSSPGLLQSHSRNNDLNVRWNAAGGTAVVITVFPSEGDGTPERGNWVFCGTDDTGSFNVPAAQLSQVNPGGGFGATAVVGVARTNVVSMGVGAADQAVLAISTSGGQGFALSR